MQVTSEGGAIVVDTREFWHHDEKNLASSTLNPTHVIVQHQESPSLPEPIVEGRLLALLEESL